MTRAPLSTMAHTAQRVPHTVPIPLELHTASQLVERALYLAKSHMLPMGKFIYVSMMWYTYT